MKFKICRIKSFFFNSLKLEHLIFIIKLIYYIVKHLNNDFNLKKNSNLKNSNLNLLIQIDIPDK